MGKIVRNGINFSGTSDSANTINYNNSVSGLEARTVQEAVDELNGSLEWNKLNEVLGVTLINISELEFKEIHIKCTFPATSGTLLAYVFNILKNELTDENVRYSHGIGYNNSNAFCQYDINENSIVLYTNKFNGSDVTNNTKTEVFYR